MLRNTLIAAAVAGSAVAQVQSPLAIIQQFLPVISQDCRDTITSLVNSSSPQYQCLRVDALLPALMTNGSIIPPVNEYLTQVCSSAPCNATIVNETASAIEDSCGSDLQKFGIDVSIVGEVIGYYDLARSVACLKNENEEVLMNATIPLNSPLFNSTGYVNSTVPSNITVGGPTMGNSTMPPLVGNSTTGGPMSPMMGNSTMGNDTLTNGTFCLTEFASNITGYLGLNLTNAYIDTALLGGNYSAIQALGAIPRTALCSDCLFAAVNLINEEIPAFGEIVVYSNSSANSTASITINQYLDQVCMAEGYNATGNGTLPEGIYESGVNSTLFPMNATSYTNETMSGNMTMPSMAPLPSMSSEVTSAAAATSTGSVVPPAASAASSALVGRMAEKRRWPGQQ